MDSETKAKFVDLFEDYSKNLPEKIQYIDELAKRLQDQWDADLFSEFYRKVHSLHGSAGVYGYIVLKQLADGLEAYLKPFLASSVDLKALNFQKITSDINALKKAWHDTSSEKALSIFLKSNIITGDAGEKNEKNSNHRR